VGILAVALIIQHFFDVEPVAGALIAVAFQGGHGTVAGLSSTFTELGFEQAQTIGLGLATIGLITAIMFGTIISNQFVKKDAEPEISHNEKSKIDINPVNYSMQLALLAFVILLGYLFLLSLQQAESWLVGDAGSGFFKYMPLFPIAMLAGLVVQKLAEKYDQAQHISQYHINITSNLALDLLIVSALGSLSLSTLSQQWQVIVALGLIGVAFNLTIYFAFAKYFFKNSWRIRGIGEIGQSMGTTAVGLLLLKQASAEDDTHVKAFSHKQPLYEPIVGGGLVTAIAVPAIASTNPWYFLIAIIASLTLILSIFFWYQRKHN
jgi:ESS family glutamate:Na+ symporter